MLNKFKLFHIYLKLTFSQKKKFKLNSFFTFIGYILEAFLCYYLWYNISLYRTTISTTSFTTEELAPYCMLVFTISIMVSQSADYYFSTDIYTGEIANILTKPISVITHYFYQSLSEFIFYLLTLFLPVYIICLFLRLHFSFLSVILGLISIFLSFMIQYIFDMIFGIFTIKLMNNWGINTMKSLVISFLSGQLLPLYLLPNLLQSILRYSPFWYLSYFSIEILFSKLNTINIIIGFIFQIIWIMILYFIFLLLWKKERKEMSINGG